MTGGPAPRLRVGAGPGGAGSVLEVKVVPGASRSRVAGVHGDLLRVQVAAPPERGRANREVCAVVAAALGVRAADVVLLRGETAPRKSLLVRTLSPDEALGRLEAALRTAAS